MNNDNNEPEFIRDLYQQYRLARARVVSHMVVRRLMERFQAEGARPFLLKSHDRYSTITSYGNAKIGLEWLGCGWVVTPLLIDGAGWLRLQMFERVERAPKHHKFSQLVEYAHQQAVIATEDQKRRSLAELRLQQSTKPCIEDD
ncbi:MAG: hypothetical protein EBU46_11210 [Nitrosomonadaceae bacterium]|nr:hypothetical protein [Nitrosomonadaceae bacterium]